MLLVYTFIDKTYLYSKQGEAVPKSILEIVEETKETKILEDMALKSLFVRDPKGNAEVHKENIERFKELLKFILNVEKIQKRGEKPCSQLCKGEWINRNFKFLCQEEDSRI